jgi:hypothetical protein
MRLNNISTEPVEVDPASSSYRKSMRILRHHPNPYYGLLDEYITAGWQDDGESISYRGCVLPKSDFAEPEASYSVAFVHLYQGEECTRLESVEDRLLGIPPSDWSDFFDIYQQADLSLLRS